MAAVRLPNGHTLVTCQNQTHVVELDQTGKVVNELKDLTYRPWRVSRRCSATDGFMPALPPLPGGTVSICG